MGESFAAERPPNIVLVMTDDQGWGDLGVHGNPVIETPNLDAMASRSVRLTYFYVSPVCTPTRASLMTGRYNYRTRAIDTYIGRTMMEPEEVTVAEVLRDGGYATGIFGKWHLGDCYPMRPQDQGFDEVLVHRGGGIGQPSDPPGGERKYTDPVLFHNGRRYEATGYCTDVYFNHAMRWIETQNQAEKPFFAYIPTNCPHGPWGDVPNELLEKYRAKDISPVLLGNQRSDDRVARGFAMIENIDQNVGRLFASLERLGISETTIVIFLCDNGPYSPRYVGNMRGRKGQVYEGGIRSPFFVHWPARLSPGEKGNKPAAHIDVMPTLLEMAGISCPKGLSLDGRSILPLIEGKAADWPERTLCWQWHRGNVPELYRHFAIRRGRWKLLNPNGSPEQAQPTPDGKQNATVRGNLELYDLETDPREQINLVAKHPDVVASLRAEYENWFRDVSTTRPDNYAPPRIILGSEQQPVVVLTKQEWRREGGQGWGMHGHWLVRVAEGKPKRFNVTARLADNSERTTGAVATLKYGETSIEQPIEPGAKEVRFANVHFPVGNAKIQILLQVGKEKHSPHQVVVAVSDE